MLSPKQALLCLCVILLTLVSLHSCDKISRREQLVVLGNCSAGPSCPSPSDFGEASLLSAYLEKNFNYFARQGKSLINSCGYSMIEKSLSIPGSAAYLNTLVGFGLNYPSRFPEIFDRISSMNYDVYSNLTDAMLKLDSFLTFPEHFCSYLTLSDLFELDSAFAASADSQANIAGSKTLFKSRNYKQERKPLLIGDRISFIPHRPHPFIVHMSSSEFLKTYEPYYPRLEPSAFHLLDSLEIKKQAFLQPDKVVSQVYNNLTFEDLCSIFATMNLEDIRLIRRFFELPVQRMNMVVDISKFNKCIPEELLYDPQATAVVEEFKQKNMRFVNNTKEDLFLTRLGRSMPILLNPNVSTTMLANLVNFIDDMAVIRFLSNRQPVRALTLLPLMNATDLTQAEFAVPFFGMTADDCAALSLLSFKGHESLAIPFLTRNLKAFENASTQTSCSYALIKNSLVPFEKWMEHSAILTTIMDEKTEHILIKAMFECMSSEVRKEIIASGYGIMKRRLFLDALAFPAQSELYSQLDLAELHRILLASFTSSEAGVLGLGYFTGQLESADIKIGGQIRNLAQRPTSVSLFKAAEELDGSVSEYLLKKALLTMINVSASISTEEFQIQSPRDKKDIFLLGKHYQAGLYGHIRPIDFQEIMSVEPISASDLRALEKLLEDLLPRHIVFGSALKYGDHLSVDGLFSYSDCANPESDACVNSKEFLRLVCTNIASMRASILGH